MTTSLMLLVLAALGHTADPALDLEVGVTSRAEALAWSEGGALACEQRSAGRWLHCTDVPSYRLGQATAPDVDELNLHFDGQGTLWKATLRREDMPIDEGGAHFERAEEGLTATLGPPRESIGHSRPARRARTVRAFAGAARFAQVVISRHADGRVTIMETRSCRR